MAAVQEGGFKMKSISYPENMVINVLAYATARGDFGNADERKKRLGKNYHAVQHKVNEMMEHEEIAKIDHAMERYKKGEITSAQLKKRIKGAF